MIILKTILDFILAIIVFAIIITVVVTAHELGHFFGAKKTKTRVDEFAIGFPPFIWKKKIKGTLFALGAIPFGGYNKIYGEDNTEEAKGSKDSFTSKTIPQKLLIIILGVVGNFLFSIVIFYIVLISSGMNTTIGLMNPDYKFPLGHQENYLMIGAVEKDSPADYAGVEANDIILKLNGERIDSAIELKESLAEKKGEAIALLVKDKETGEESVRLINNNKDAIGIGYTNISNISYNENLGDKIFAGIFHTYNFTDYSLSTLGYMISKSFSEKDFSVAANAIAGPVGIFAVTKVSLGEGFIYMLNLLAIISLALAVTNLMPLPALDGGKCIYLICQKINPKVFTDKLSENIDNVGFILLMGLGILIVVKDLFQFKDLIF
ncbi:MAG: M50 family metallopeptidase [Candidatus Pacebacteria bacterium]|nr:M50 family metallopeptidase [Candidatus Paceibacterota bacterium]